MNKHKLAQRLVMGMLGGNENKNEAKFYCTTTGAATLTIESMTVITGKTVTVNWGDGNSDIYAAGTGARTHNYAGAGVYPVSITPPTDISKLYLSDNKITLNSAEIKSAVNITDFKATTLKAGTFNSSDISAWRPSSFNLFSMPAGYAGTFNLSDISAWRPSYFNLFSMPAGYAITITSSYFSGWITIIYFQVHNNLLPQSIVDQILSDFWAGFSTRTATGGTINVGGTNAAPSGILQAANPPTTGKEFAYELTHDSQNINPTKKWTTVTITA